MLKSRELHFKYNLETVFLYTDVPQKKTKNYDLSLAVYKQWSALGDLKTDVSTDL